MYIGKNQADPPFYQRESPQAGCECSQPSGEE